MFNKIILIANLLSISVGVGLSAEDTQPNAAAAMQKPKVVAASSVQKAPVAIAATLSPEELAFAARLSDQNRRAFVDKLNAEQRKEAMEDAKASTVADAGDEAVAKLCRMQEGL